MVREVRIDCKHYLGYRNYPNSYCAIHEVNIHALKSIMNIRKNCKFCHDYKEIGSHDHLVYPEDRESPTLRTNNPMEEI